MLHTLTFSSLDSIFYFSQSKLEYVSCMEFCCTNKLEHINQKFVVFCYNHFFSDPLPLFECFRLFEFSYFMHVIQLPVDVLFLINVYSGSICYSSLLDTVGIHVPAHNFRFSMVHCWFVTCHLSFC